MLARSPGREEEAAGGGGGGRGRGEGRSLELLTPQFSRSGFAARQMRATATTSGPV